MSRVVGGAGQLSGTGQLNGPGWLGGAPFGEEVRVERGPAGPVQFWRGSSRYLVGELLDSWIETVPWWRAPALAGGASVALVADREVWRVEAVRAGRSRLSFAGVYDLSWSAADNRWSLVRVHD